MPLFLASAVLGMSAPYIDKNGEHREIQPKPLVRGYEHKGKSLERLEKRRANRKRLKAKKNAKKGIYANKIKYPKKRS